jgi:hypothetical protein
VGHQWDSPEMFRETVLNKAARQSQDGDAIFDVSGPKIDLGHSDESSKPIVQALALQHSVHSAGAVLL